MHQTLNPHPPYLQPTPTYVYYVKIDCFPSLFNVIELEKEVLWEHCELFGSLQISMGSVQLRDFTLVFKTQRTNENQEYLNLRTEGKGCNLRSLSNNMDFLSQIHVIIMSNSEGKSAQKAQNVSAWLPTGLGKIKERSDWKEFFGQQIQFELSIFWSIFFTIRESASARQRPGRYAMRNVNTEAQERSGTSHRCVMKPQLLHSGPLVLTAQQPVFPCLLRKHWGKSIPNPTHCSPPRPPALGAPSPQGPQPSGPQASEAPRLTYNVVPLVLIVRGRKK